MEMTDTESYLPMGHTLINDKIRGVEAYFLLQNKPKTGECEVLISKTIKYFGR